MNIETLIRELEKTVNDLRAENETLKKMHKEAITWGDKGWSSSNTFQLENVRLKNRIKDLESDVFYGGNK